MASVLIVLGSARDSAASDSAYLKVGGEEAKVKYDYDKKAGLFEVSISDGPVKETVYVKNLTAQEVQAAFQAKLARHIDQIDAMPEQDSGLRKKRKALVRYQSYIPYMNQIDTRLNTYNAKWNAKTAYSRADDQASALKEEIKIDQKYHLSTDKKEAQLVVARQQRDDLERKADVAHEVNEVAVKNDGAGPKFSYDNLYCDPENHMAEVKSFNAKFDSPEGKAAVASTAYPQVLEFTPQDVCSNAVTMCTSPSVTCKYVVNESVQFTLKMPMACSFPRRVNCADPRIVAECAKFTRGGVREGEFLTEVRSRFQTQGPELLPVPNAGQAK